MINNFFLPPENHAIYELTWKITVQLDRPQTYVVLNALLLQQWLHKCASLLCYMYTRVNKNPSACNTFA